MDSAELTAMTLTEREVEVLLLGAGMKHLDTPDSEELQEVSFVTVEGGGTLSLPEQDGHLYDQCFVANVDSSAVTVTVRTGVTVSVAAGKSKLFARTDADWAEVQ